MSVSSNKCQFWTIQTGLDAVAWETKAFHGDNRLGGSFWGRSMGALQMSRLKGTLESAWPISRISQMKGHRLGLIKGHLVKVMSRRENWAVESQGQEPAHKKWKAGMEA